jgi:uncharacterized protein (TIGR02246 family)
MFGTHGRFFAAASALLLAACGGMAEIDMMGTPEDEAAIRDLSTQYAAAYSARDAAALANLATEDYQAVSPDGQMVNGRAALQTMMAEEMNMMPADLQMQLSATTDFVRWIDADNAVAGGTWTASGAPEGMGPDRGSWIAVARQDADGTWRMASGMSAPYMPPPAMPDSTGM